MWNAVEQVRSGIVRVRHTHREEAPGVLQETHAEFYQAFDYDKELMRQDYQSDRSKFHTQYARNETESLVHVGGKRAARSVNRYPRDRKPTVGDAVPIDLRTVGMTGSGMYLARRELTWLRDKIRNAGTKRTLTAFTRHGSVNKLTWEYPAKIVSGGRGRTVLHIDADRGYRPVRYEDWHLIANGQGKTRWHLTNQTTTEWTEVNGAWVPVKWLTINSSPFLKDQKTTVNVTLQWKSVNEPVPAKLFTMEGLELPIGTTVYNQRTGKQIKEGRIGDEPPPKFDSPAEAAKRGERKFRWLMALNVALLTAIVGVLWWYKRRTGNSRESSVQSREPERN